MDISEIKERLGMAAVLQHYGLTPDRNNRLHCPFHDDRTPSLQVYPHTESCYCFSSRCLTHGKSIDVIDFIMHKEHIDKHGALQRAAALIAGARSHNELASGQNGTEAEQQKEFTGALSLPETPAESVSDAACGAEGMSNKEERAAFLGRLFGYFKKAVYNSPAARAYIESRGLDYRQIEVGYNGGQFHHGERKNETLIRNCLEYGLLIDKGLKNRTGDAYSVFGKWCIVFPLKDSLGHVVSLYFRSTLTDRASRHFYLKERQGLYPGYPANATHRLLLTESVIDAASLLENGKLKIEDDELCYVSVLACYGTNGLTEEHLQAIQGLSQLEELIFAFDNDEAGLNAVQKYTSQLSILPLQFSTLELPCKDVNETLTGHNGEVFTYLFKNRKPLTVSDKLNIEQAGEVSKRESVFSFSAENTIEKEQTGQQDSTGASADLSASAGGGVLNSENPYNLYYSGVGGDYWIKGGLRSGLDALKVSLQFAERDSGQELRTKLDLYEHRQTGNFIKLAEKQTGACADLLREDMSQLTSQLETYRLELLQRPAESQHRKPVAPDTATMNKCLNFLKSGNLLEGLGELLGACGIVGEDSNRLFLFLIASSYRMRDTLHALIQGSSGSGKTRLLKIICETMPPEDVIKFTRVTDNSFYNYREDYLSHKLLGFEDMDGLKEEAMYAVRELISNEILVSSTTTKTESGQLVSVERTVRGPVASISCTTRGEIYEDNMSRLFLIAVDESTEQTRRIIAYQQQLASGATEQGREKTSREFLQHCIRLLKAYDVVNPYAFQVQLPEEAHKIRRLNDLYLSFVKQITLLHQYQREKDARGRLLSNRSDLQAANRIMFESIVLKVDELDGGLRHFFERLKEHVRAHGGRGSSFILRDIRQALRVSKTQLHRYVSELVSMEYLQQSGYANRGYQYRIVYWDNIAALRGKIKEQLDKQLEKLGVEN